MTRHYLCSNPDCSPLLPFVGQPLAYRMGTDRTTTRCPACKREYASDMQPVGVPCPRCRTTLVPKTMRIRYCPNCHRCQ